jgi:hypothetical protein
MTSGLLSSKFMDRQDGPAKQVSLAQTFCQRGTQKVDKIGNLKIRASQGSEPDQYPKFVLRHGDFFLAIYRTLSAKHHDLNVLLFFLMRGESLA